METVVVRDTTRFDFVDALRGWAILGVVMVHATTGLVLPSFVDKVAQAGRTGVMLFFIVSAFTILLSLDRRSNYETSPIRNFFIRRFFRIAPMFYTALVFYRLRDGLDPHFWAPNGLTIGHILATLTFLHGWYITSLNSVVPGGWTVGVEFCFYAIAPFLYVRIKRISGAVAIIVIGLAVALGATFAFEAVYAGSFSPNLIAEYSLRWPVSQLPTFMLGMVMFLLWKKSDGSGTRSDAYIYTFAGLFFMLALTSGTIPWINSYFLFGVAILLFTYGVSLYSIPLFVNRVTRFIGTISFSLYLVHFAINDLVHAYLALPGPPVIAYLINVLVVLAVAVPISALTYRFVEQPGIRLGKRIIQRLEKADRVQTSRSATSVA